MKSLILFLALAALITSCNQNENSSIKCIISNKTLSIKNANTTLSVGNDLAFSVKFKKDIISGDKNRPSVCLSDTEGNKLTFTRGDAHEEDINDEHGKGRLLKIESRSVDNNILCEISLSAYYDIPDAILIQASFRNTWERNMRDLVML
jgi:hypothetical protein